MTGLFGGGGGMPVPQVARTETAPASERTDNQTSALADQQRSRYARRGTGRAMNMLTGGGGADSAVSAIRFLGGAART